MKGTNFEHSKFFQWWSFIVSNDDSQLSSEMERYDGAKRIKIELSLIFHFKKGGVGIASSHI